LQVAGRYLAQSRGLAFGSDEHLHAVLECFDLKRLTTQVRATLLATFARSLFPADEFWRDLNQPDASNRTA
jgi:hypothetical protein